MSLSRRAFVRVLGAGGAGALLAGRGAGGSGRLWRDAFGEPLLAAAGRPILLHNNENPLGPGPSALDAIRAALRGGPEAGRYPGGFGELAKAIAGAVGVAPENILTGCGSTQLLRTAVQVFTSPSRPLLTSFPAYEECTDYAVLIKSPVRTVPVDAKLRHDVMAIAAAAKGAGMIFIDNPSNPTATVRSHEDLSAFITRAHEVAPDATIMIDEAYHDYVTDPSYRSQVARAAGDPRLVVARTFSKAHGCAGLRVGYVVSHPDTIKTMSAWDGGGAMNLLGIAAATASIQDPARIDRERARNTEARQFTIDWFRKAGMTATDSQTNFLFVNLGRPARPFREACREQGVLVARDFPPFEQTHCRISIGTLEEMRQATAVFGAVLGVRAAAA